jgi:hypothetical protein
VFATMRLLLVDVDGPSWWRCEGVKGVKGSSLRLTSSEKALDARQRIPKKLAPPTEMSRVP